MNGIEFWKERVYAFVQEHGLVVTVDRFSGETDVVDDKTIGQIAEDLIDAHLEYQEYYEDCRDCAGKGYFKPKYEPCQMCGMSGKVSIL